MSKRVIIFLAEYGVLFEGGIFFLLCLQNGWPLGFVRVVIFGSLILFVSLFTSTLLKIMIRKKRPARRKWMFSPSGSYAFPSGHATCLSAFVFLIAFHSVVLGIFSCIMAILIIVARVKARVHDPVDMLGGIIVGVSVASLSLPYITSVITPYLLTVFF